MREDALLAFVNVNFLQLTVLRKKKPFSEEDICALL
jgi:hypothetical protein